MKLLSLFAGIGGFDLAAQRCGIETATAAEIDPSARSVFQCHFPNTEVIHDVKHITKTEASIITAGWPCQGNSVAGRRAGLSDPRSGLWGEVRRILEANRPKFFLGENVPGLLSVNRGRDFAIILRDLAELGYGFAYRVLDAQFFGVPQRRRRVFIVGCFGNWRRSAEILFERESVCGDIAKGGEARKGTAQTIAPCLRASGVWSERIGDTRGQDCIVANTLNAHSGSIDGESETFIPAIARTLTHRQDGSPCIDRGPEVVACTLPASNGGVSSGMHPIIFESKSTVPVSSSAVSPTVRSMSGARLNGGGQIAVQSPSMGVRRLMPIECERLQGFPDNWTRYGHDGKEISDSARYRMIGNSVAVPCVEWIMKRITQH